MAEVSLDAGQIIGLLRHSKQVGTQDKALDLAMEWIEAAGKELTRAFSKGLPKIVCLCGSTRFYDAFQEANFRETMAGHIVLTVGFYASEDGLRPGGITAEEKERLDELYRRKIDLADEILVLNVGGYVGDSTRGEIEYARSLGKPVRWLEELVPGLLSKDG